MDLDFITKMLGGQGAANPIAMLLPLLLGGKSPDLSSLIGAFGGGKRASAADSFPPLFGSGKGDQGRDASDLMGLLGNLMPTGSVASSRTEKAPKYPYELQYNRPFSPKKEGK